MRYAFRSTFSKGVSSSDVLIPSIAALLLLILLVAISWQQRREELSRATAYTALVDAIGYHRTVSIRALGLVERAHAASVSPLVRPPNAAEQAALAAELRLVSTDALTLVQRSEVLAGARIAERITDLTRRIETLLSQGLDGDAGANRLDALRLLAQGIVADASALNRELATTITPAKWSELHRTQDILTVVLGLVVVGFMGFVVLPARQRWNEETARHERLSKELLTLSTVVRRTRNAVVVTDPAGAITWVNDAFTEISGYALEEVRGRTPGSILQFEKTNPETIARLRDAIRRREPIRCEILNRAKSGREYWLDLDIQPLWDANGDLEGFVGVEWDVTESREMIRLIGERNRDLETMSSIAAIGVWTWPAGALRPVLSSEARAVLGLSDPSSAAFAAVRRAIAPSMRRSLGRLLADCGRGARASFTTDVVVHEPGLAERWIRITARAEDENRELIGSVQDVTDLVTAHREALAATARLELAADSARLGLLDWDVDDDHLYVSDAWWRCVGFAVAPQLDGIASLVGLAHPDDRAELASRFAAFPHRADESLHLVFRLSSPSGEARWTEIVARLVVGADTARRRVSGVLRDVHEEYSSVEQARYAASHDLMTGLANRAQVTRHIESLVREPKPEGRAAVMLIDLDRFKAVNDTFGHATGDAVLVAVGERLRKCVRTHDLVGRLGGDEFALVLVGEKTIEEDCAALATRIIAAIDEPIVVDGRLIRIGTSIGVAVIGRDGTGADDILRSADAALYRSKLAGKGRYSFFDDSLAAVQAERRSLEADLREAIARDELALFYQPEVDLRTGAVKAAEGLLRWRHRVRGLVPPDKFISIAEETGLIVAIGNWVIETACREAASWPDDTKVAVNVSPAQVGKVDLVRVVQAALASAGIAPERLEVEITENVLLSADPTLLRDLTLLSNMGVRLALDDFGTGYSSLSYLRRLPFKRIKIDRSFVSDIERDTQARAIVSAIADLAHALGMETTAEGVETIGQKRILQDIGVTLAQGFLYGRPTPKPNFAEAASTGSVISGPWTS